MHLTHQTPSAMLQAFGLVSCITNGVFVRFEKRKKTSPGYTTKNYPKLPESTKISIFEKVKTTHSSLTTKTMLTDIRFNKKKVNHFQGTTEELFSSKVGTLRSLRGDFSFPTVEKKISKGGKESFQRRKIKFPALEIYFSKAGKFLENRGAGSMGEVLCPQSGTFAL